MGKKKRFQIKEKTFEAKERLRYISGGGGGEYIVEKIFSF